MLCITFLVKMWDNIHCMDFFLIALPQIVFYCKKKCNHNEIITEYFLQYVLAISKNYFR